MKKLFFALITSFLFVATAWGQCGFFVTPKDQVYELGETGSSIFYVPEEGYTSVTLELSIAKMATGNTEIILYNINSSNVGSIKVNASDLSATSYKSYTINAIGNSNIRYIRVLNDGPLNKKVRNIVAKRADNSLTSTNELNFESRSLGVDVVRSINLYSNNSGNLTIKLEKDDDLFSIDKTTISSCGCDEIVNIKFSPKEYGIFSNNLQIINSNGTSKTIPINGFCSATDLPSDNIVNYIEYSLSREVSFTASTRGAIEYYIDANKTPTINNVERVEFEAKTAKRILFSPIADPDMYLNVYEYDNNKFNEDKYWKGKGNIKENEYMHFNASIPADMIALRFETGLSNGSLGRYVRNLNVYSKTILEDYVENLNFQTVKVGEYKEEFFELKFANAKTLLADVKYNNPVTASYAENGQSFYKVEFLQNDEKAEGTQTVKVTFTPSNCVENYDATLTFYNGKTVTINLTGARVRNSGTVSEITWTGAVDANWDNRANWKKADGNVLSAADVLDEKLKVNIPAGLAQYPVIPDVSTAKAFKEDRDKACDCAQVNAGDNATAKMIADKIYMANGAALVGVETLNVGTLRYNEVEIDFTPVRCYKDDKDSLRYDWTLVGPIVKPWNEDKPGETRNVVSGDYFLHDLPHVYMHKAEVKEDPKTGLLSAMWNESFPDLDVDLTHERAFAIRIPDQYGRNLEWWGMKFEKLPAEVYNSLFLKEGETPYDGTAPHTYTFKGRFYNDASLPTYTLPNAGEIVALNNSYPANIDAQKLKAGIGREIQYYDYINKGFVALGGNNKSIMSQSSFIIEAKANSEKIDIKREWFETSKTAHRGASVDTESFRIELRNKVASSASEIYVCYDPLKEDALNYSVDATKVFNTMEVSLPDLYSMRYNNKLSGLVIPTLSEPIPLGINVSLEDQTFTFSLKECTLSADVILEDRQTNTQYNLSEGEICEVEGLKTGLCEGRFYLLLSEQEEEDSEISTGIDDALIGDIDIYSNGNSVVVSSTSDIELMQIVVSDMAGRSQVYNVSDNYAQINLPVGAGVYTINVIGDKSSRVEKIKLN